MNFHIPHLLARSMLIILVVSLVAIHARPSHFGENNQLVSEQESNNNLVENNLKPWQVEMMLQRLAEYNSNMANDMGFDRALRSGNEIKRQSRYRLCYFNPVSCFRK